MDDLSTEDASEEEARTGAAFPSPKPGAKPLSLASILKAVTNLKRWLQMQRVEYSHQHFESARRILSYYAAVLAYSIGELEKMWVSDPQLDKIFSIGLLHDGSMSRRRPFASQLSIYTVALLLSMDGVGVTSWLRNIGEPEAIGLTWDRLTIRLARYTSTHQPELVVVGLVRASKQRYTVGNAPQVPFTYGTRTDGRLDREVALCFCALALIAKVMHQDFARAMWDPDHGKMLIRKGGTTYYDFTTQSQKPVFVVAGVNGPDTTATDPMTQQAFRNAMANLSKAAGFERAIGSSTLRRSQNMAVRAMGIISEGEQAVAMRHSSLDLQRRVYRSTLSPQNRTTARYGLHASTSANITAAVDAIATVPMRPDTTVLSLEDRELYASLISDYEDAIDSENETLARDIAHVIQHRCRQLMAGANLSIEEAIKVLAVAADGTDDGGANLGWEVHPFCTQTDGSSWAPQTGWCVEALTNARAVSAQSATRSVRVSRAVRNRVALPRYSIGATHIMTLC